MEGEFDFVPKRQGCQGPAESDIDEPVPQDDERPWDILLGSCHSSSELSSGSHAQLLGDVGRDGEQEEVERSLKATVALQDGHHFAGAHARAFLHDGLFIKRQNGSARFAELQHYHIWTHQVNDPLHILLTGGREMSRADNVHTTTIRTRELSNSLG